MSSNIFSILNTAKLGLLSQQLAIEVTGNNIANVETDGYSRQDVILESNTPRSVAQGQLGTGVRVSGIERVFDQFLFQQILSEGDPTGDFKVRKDVFEQLEVLFNENQGRSLNSELSGFFGALQDLSSNPNGLPERAEVINRAQSVAAVFNTLGEGLFQIQRNIDAIIADEVAGINTLADEIGKLNKAIFANEPGEFSANDLRDQRDRLVTQLSEKIDITYVNESDGQISLTLKDGTPLVLKDVTFDLSTGLNGNNKSFLDVFISNGAGGTTNVTSAIQGGGLKGYLDMRDTEVAAIQGKLNRLAAGFVQEFNRVHQGGFGLDGSTGVNFFTPLDPTVFTNVQNTGSALVSVQNASPTTVSVDDYEITFTGANSFSLNNLTTGASSGTFTFTPGSTFNLAGGFAVNITGTAAVGDRFKFSVSENAAKFVEVSNAVVSNSQKIAAGNSTAGDGSNAGDLADLQSDLTFNSVTLQSGSGAFTFDEFYNALVSAIGIQSASAQAGVRQQEGVLLQLNNRRQSISGVSIDEELINLIQFQQAFNASARMISLVEELFDTLINRI
ncbi:MAG: flagellar hook-associated protein 1 [Nitrospinaceae bacterium]|nr:MAG: flagellar hook-associated protein 1 [Nitrospinaceae bacterium]